MTVLLASLAALSYGISDFLGGIGSRRRSAITILLTSSPAGAVVMLLALPLVPGHPTARTFVFGALGGLVGLMGVTLMYHSMTLAPLNVVSPVTGVLAAVIPVVFGVASGERPHLAAWFGIALALVSVILVSRTPEDHPHGPIAAKTLTLACMAGIGFGLYFVCLDHAGQHAGGWPVVISRIASSILVVPLAWRTGNLAPVGRDLLPLTIVVGAFDAGANLFFLLAAHHGYLSLAGVITSLYPAATVLLAVAVLREHTGRVQRIGLALAVLAIVLITT